MLLRASSTGLVTLAKGSSHAPAGHAAPEAFRAGERKPSCCALQQRVQSLESAETRLPALTAVKSRGCKLLSPKNLQGCPAGAEGGPAADDLISPGSVATPVTDRATLSQHKKLNALWYLVPDVPIKVAFKPLPRADSQEAFLLRQEWRQEGRSARAFPAPARKTALVSLGHRPAHAWVAKPVLPLHIGTTALQKLHLCYSSTTPRSSSARVKNHWPLRSGVSTASTALTQGSQNQLPKDTSHPPSSLLGYCHRQITKLVNPILRISLICWK